MLHDEHPTFGVLHDRVDLPALGPRPRTGARRRVHEHAHVVVEDVRAIAHVQRNDRAQGDAAIVRARREDRARQKDGRYG